MADMGDRIWIGAGIVGVVIVCVLLSRGLGEAKPAPEPQAGFHENHNCREKVQTR